MNDKKIIAAIAARDERMLAFVIQKYSRLLWKIVASVLINAASVQDVEECVADVFIYLWQFPEKYDPDKTKLSSWLSIVARSRAVDSYRRIIKKREISIYTSMEDIVVESPGYTETAIQAIVQEKTGAAIVPDRKTAGYMVRQMALLAGSLLCFVILCAFAYVKFSSLNGDEAGFGAVYQGDGRYEIIIINESDKELKLQDKVKVMQWSTGKEVKGDNGKIRMKGLTIAPHSQGVVSIDLSEGYDIDVMEENLPEGDGYYFVLTNNNFAFGQDWMCFFDFEIERTEDVMDRFADFMEQMAEEQKVKEQMEIIRIMSILPGQPGMKSMQLRMG